MWDSDLTKCYKGANCWCCQCQGLCHKLCLCCIQSHGIHKREESSISFCKRENRSLKRLHRFSKVKWLVNSKIWARHGSLWLTAPTFLKKGFVHSTNATCWKLEESRETWFFCCQRGCNLVTAIEKKWKILSSKFSLYYNYI